MNAAVLTVLGAMLAFQIKHFICDFVLQTAYQYKNKGFYGHFGGIIHAGLHILGSLPALLILTHDAALIAGLLAAEFVIHYHMDWLKVRTDMRLGLNDQMHAYWILFGVDQFVHQLTYLAMIFVVLKYFSA